jgi:sulfur carrier protein
VKVLLNGDESELALGETLIDLLARLNVSPERRGCAVAVDGEVVPRAQWREFSLREHARVEVLTAMQGG